MNFSFLHIFAKLNIIELLNFCQSDGYETYLIFKNL